MKSKSYIKIQKELLKCWSSLAHIEDLINEPTRECEAMACIPMFFDRHISSKIAEYNTSLEKIVSIVENENEDEDLTELSFNAEVIPHLTTLKINVTSFFSIERNKLFDNRLFLQQYFREKLKSLEKWILNLSNIPALNNTKKVSERIFNHTNNLGKATEYKIPTFFMWLINRRLPFCHDVEDFELVEFFKNPTVIFLLKQIYTTDAGLALIGGGHDENFFYKFLADLEIFKIVHLIKVMQSKKMAEAVFNIKITSEEETKYFIGNKVFYKIIYGYLRKLTSEVPTYQNKRKLIPFIQGQVKPYVLIFSLAARMYPKYLNEVIKKNPEPYKKALGLITNPAKTELNK